MSAKIDRDGESERLTKSTSNFAAQLALGQIHRVGYGDHDQSRVRQMRPVEEVVDDLLALREHLIEFVDQDDPGPSRVAEGSACCSSRESSRTDSRSPPSTRGGILKVLLELGESLFRSQLATSLLCTPLARADRFPKDRESGSGLRNLEPIDLDKGEGIDVL